jgi:hypothetical protein
MYIPSNLYRLIFISMYTSILLMIYWKNITNYEQFEWIGFLPKRIGEI